MKHSQGLHWFSYADYMTLYSPNDMTRSTKGEESCDGQGGRRQRE